MLNYLLKHIKLTKTAQKWLRVSYAKQALKNDYFFQSLFSKVVGKNLASLNLQSGVVQGTYRDVSYFLQMEPRQFIETHVLLEGVWEPHVLQVIQSFLRPGSVMLDIGSNIGATAIPLAKANPECCFICFEPHPQIFQKLHSNVALNRLTNLELNNIALSDNELGHVDFYAQPMTDKNLGLSSLMQNKALRNFETIKIPNTSIDALLASAQWPSVSVLKIDTQGSELSILRSAKNLISKFRPSIVFEHESSLFNDEVEESKARIGLLKFFEEHGYELYCLQRSSKYMPKVTLEEKFNGDILALPKQPSS